VIRRGAAGTLASMALLAVGCGSVPHATVSPISAGPPASTPAPAAARPQEIAPESIIEVIGADTVTGDHVVKVRRFHGTVSIDDPIGCEFAVDMTSLKAESSLIEDFIKSPRFLDVRRYPEARFTTTRVRAGRAAGSYVVEGRLSLHGVDKEISFPATLEREEGVPHVRANFLLPRRAFNLILSGIWETLLEDDIRVRLDLVVRAKS
jgi:polyisoprenoid-binding protein YceI